MSSKLVKSAVAAALAGAFLAGAAAQAYETGDWLFRIGAYGVFPESDNLTNVLGTGATLNVGVLSGAHTLERLQAAPHTHIVESVTKLGWVIDKLD